MANVERVAQCAQCGEHLPVQHGRGRVRRYCGATCRSAARRQRSDLSRVSRPIVKETLTGTQGQGTVDNVAVAGDLLGAIRPAQDVVRKAEEGLAMAVRRARGAGRTWAEIGTVLGTSRQAAFQRFGRPTDPRTSKPMADAALPDATDRALVLFADLTAGRWERVCQNFDERVAEKLDVDGLAAAWAQVIGMVGNYEHCGNPQAHQAGDYTVVNVPLFFEAGERVGRVSYDREGWVAGLFFLRSEQEF